MGLGATDGHLVRPAALLFDLFYISAWRRGSNPAYFHPW